jgi:serine O-acetyltransferase
MLIKLLKKDLERLYFYSGQPGRVAGGTDVLRNIFNPRFAPVFICRAAHSFYLGKHPVLARLASLANFTLFGIEMAVGCEVGPGLCFAHTNGIVIGARKIGANVLIYHQVTLGAKEMDVVYTAAKRPLVGDNVVLGAGAKVLGGITIGDNSIIGANAVVTHDIPANVVAGGIPARVLKQRDSK